MTAREEKETAWLKRLNVAKTGKSIVGTVSEKDKKRARLNRSINNRLNK